MKRFIVKLLLAINILLAFLLLLAYLSAIINPTFLWIFAFIGMAYPVFLVLNMLFFIFWIFNRKWYFLISLVSILIGWGPVKKYFQIRGQGRHTEQEGTSFRLLTYNVRLFNYYQWHSDTAASEHIMEYIRQQAPDVVCFQEFITVPDSKLDLVTLKEQLSFLPYVHVNYTSVVPGKVNFGMATFSRFPIVAKGEVDFTASLNGSIYSDIKVQDDTIRIYNCHLQSVKLQRNYNNLIDSLILHYNEKQLEEIRDISSRMRQAFIQRADQVNLLSDNISTSPYPVIVCGDFNDTPLSYAYHTMIRGKKDAFVESGSGFGTTYRGLVPYMRIDYILHDDHFIPYGFQIERSDWSDHFPIVTGFMIKQPKEGKQ